MLKELINQFYSDRAKKRNEKDQTRFYISDAGKCPRAVYFRFKGAPKKELEPEKMRVFEVGDHTHMRLLSVLFSLGLVRATEIKIPPQEIISGKADAIIGFEDGKPWLIDFKSISDFAFQKLNEPRPDHVKQVQLYMHYFKVPQGILLYENKNTQELREFQVQYNSTIVQRLLGELEILKEQIEKDTIPFIPKDLESWRCEYCEYQEECQRAEKSRLEKFKE